MYSSSSWNGAVHQRQAICFERAGGQVQEVTKIFRAELRSRPFNRGTCDGIQVFGVAQAADGLVVIASDDEPDHAAHTIDNFIGVRTVADHVAQTNGLLPTAFRSGKRRRQAGRIRMQVTDHQEAHERVSFRRPRSRGRGIINDKVSRAHASGAYF